MARFSFLFLVLMAQLVFSQDWEQDFSMALAKTKTEGKKLLLVFSGSDWCTPCVRLDRKVWQTQDFKDFASEKLVLYKADFPRKKKNQLPKTVLDMNKTLAEKYGLESFPKVILLNGDETVQGYLVNLEMTPKAYISILDNLLK